MSATTGPILAAGAITWSNHTFFDQDAEFDFAETVRTVVGTSLAAGFLFLIEKASTDLASALAWTALLTVLLVPIRGSRDSPATNALKFLGVV
jgi:hypothetical protein